MGRTAVSAASDKPLSHNLQGQRLGRKGRDTRERILAATERLLAGPAGTPISLSAVARDASLGMTTLYLYFSDLTELLLAVLEPITHSAEERYIGHLRQRWPDDELAEHCRRFVDALHAFWQQHSRILHLRNSYADNKDTRMMAHRIQSSQPVLSLLIRQMDGAPDEVLTPTAGMASSLLTAVERGITIWTDTDLAHLTSASSTPYVENMLASAARLMEIGIRDRREARRKQSG